MQQKPYPKYWITSFNTLHKHRIIASIDPQNKDSIRLFKRLNFHLVNKRPDDVIYEILEIKIEKIIENKKRFLDLLLLADEQENMIDKYLPDGDLFALYDGDLKSVCVVLAHRQQYLRIEKHSDPREISGQRIRKDFNKIHCRLLQKQLQNNAL